MGEINELISRIKQKKELAGIADSIVRESLEDYVRKEGIDLNAIGMREEKIVVKEIRKGLRKYAGRFESSADRKKFLDKENWRGLLESHSSTRERIENYPELKEIIYGLNVKSILDLGCGLNPIAIAKQGIEYYASDINQEILGIIEEFFKKERITGRTFVYDLRKIGDDLPPADLGLLLNVFDVVEKRGHKLAEKILLSLKCKYIIASFSTKTLSGKPMNHPQRGWIERLLGRLGWKFDIKKMKNEVFYIIGPVRQ